MDDGKALRIDRWLMFTRFYKTRGLAVAAVEGGHVRINGERAKPGSRVKEGDVIELVRQQLPYRMTVARIPVRRGPASEASACYVEDDDTIRQRDKMIARIRSDRQQMPMTKGRPDKHTRRQLRERNRRND